MMVCKSTTSGRPFKEKYRRWGVERARECGENTTEIRKMWCSLRRENVTIIRQAKNSKEAQEGEKETESPICKDKALRGRQDLHV